MADSRLRMVNRGFEQAQAAAHAGFRRAYNELLKKHELSMGSTVLASSGRPIPNLMAHFDHPQEFHEELAAARQAFLGAMTQAQEARHTTARAMPRR